MKEVNPLLMDKTHTHTHAHTHPPTHTHAHQYTLNTQHKRFQGQRRCRHGDDRYSIPLKCFTDEDARGDRLIDGAGSPFVIPAFPGPEEPRFHSIEDVSLCVRGKRREKIATALAVRAISLARFARGVIEELKRSRRYSGICLLLIRSFS